MRVVTTVHKAGFEQYGHRWVESQKNWPKNTEFLMYAEGFEANRNVRDIPELVAFKARHAGYRPPDWRFDVVRFSNIVFALHDALYDYQGIGMRLDADAVTYRKIPKGFVEKQLDGHYLGYFGRQGMYSETGIILFDCSHPLHREFLDAWRDWYLSGRFKNLPHWHDCMAFDMAMRKTGVPAKNLSADPKHMHPISVSEFGKYVDHCKGARKELGISPENKFRKAA